MTYRRTSPNRRPRPPANRLARTAVLAARQYAPGGQAGRHSCIRRTWDRLKVAVLATRPAGSVGPSRTGRPVPAYRPQAWDLHPANRLGRVPPVQQIIPYLEPAGLEYRFRVFDRQAIWTCATAIGFDTFPCQPSPRAVTLTQLRFASLTVVSLREDLHPQDRAHAGRTKKRPPTGGRFARTAVKRQAEARLLRRAIKPTRPRPASIMA